MKMLPVLYAGALLLPICVLTGADSSVTKADVDRMMQTLSNWGRWGKSDELGALNLVTKEKRLQAAALVREGTHLFSGAQRHHRTSGRFAGVRTPHA